MNQSQKAAELHKLSLKYLESIDIKHRKKNGQYFTPRSIREKLLKQIPLRKNASILDPACGSGEFLLSAYESEPTLNLTGWEIDRKLVTIAKKVVPSAKIRNLNSLLQSENKYYDVIIGNPPYFEFKPDQKLKKNYSDIINGRPNIFGFFIKMGLELLKDDGYLGFVVPPSMNNGAYFSRLREYIINHSNIEHLELIKSPAMFHQAQQTVMIIVLKKGKNRGNYIFEKNGLSIFTTNRAKLRQLFKNKTTLYELGFTVKTGSIVWNQHKEKLTDNAENSIRLIRSEDISVNKIAPKLTKKFPAYIKSEKFQTGPAIVVKRVTGSFNSLNFKAAPISKQTRFLAENHVNVITPPPGFGWSDLKDICRQLNSAETLEAIKLISGNTQISKTELEKLIPIEI